MADACVVAGFGARMKPQHGFGYVPAMKFSQNQYGGARAPLSSSTIHIAQAFVGDVCR